MKLSFFYFFSLIILPALLCAEPSDQKPFNYSKDGGWELTSFLDDCGHCASRCWGKVEYIHWAMRASPRSNPLVTEGPLVRNLDPTLGQPGTSIVLGNKKVKIHSCPGGRFTLGCRLDDCNRYATEIDYLFSVKRESTAKVSSSGEAGSPFLAFPFFNPVTGKDSSSSIALPTAFPGLAVLKTTSRMEGAEWNVIFKILATKSAHDVSLFTGFRYWVLNETFVFNTNSPNIRPPKETFHTKDIFKTFNQFYGWQLGMETAFLWNDFFCAIKGKTGLGVMRKNLTIKGELVTNTFNNFGADQSFPAGYLAMPTNTGSKYRNEFGAVSEININFGYRLTHCLNIEIGYSGIYVNSIMRANNQASQCINPSQVPAISLLPTTTVRGINRPLPFFNTASFWAQGFGAALEFSF